MKKPIPGFPAYQIDTDGTITYSTGKRDKVLVPRLHTKDKYLEARLTHEGKRTPRKVHRLVALTFLPNPENKPLVDHIDGDMYNNKLSNLRWASFCENVLNTGKFRDGGDFSIHRINNPCGTHGFSVRVSIGNGERKYLGYQNTIEEARELRDEFYKDRIKQGLHVPGPILSYYNV